MLKTIDLPYGAFELKRRYRQNMILGTGFSAGASMLIIFSLWLFGILGDDASNEKEVIIVRTIVDIGPPPSIVPPKPQVQISKLGVVAPKIGIPIPVDNDEIFEEETRILSRNELRELHSPGIEGERNGRNIEIIVNPPPDENIRPDTFKAVEIPPEPVYMKLPKYPPLAQAAGFTGWVWLEVLVDRYGDVKEAKAVRCNRPGIGFEEEAVAAALQCKYRPAIQNGEPISVRITYRVDFKF